MTQKRFDEDFFATLREVLEFSVSHHVTMKFFHSFPKTPNIIVWAKKNYKVDVSIPKCDYFRCTPPTMKVIGTLIFQYFCAPSPEDTVTFLK